MNERGVQGGEQPDIARRVQGLEDYCRHGDLALEGLQNRIVGIPPDAVRGSYFFLRACANEGVTLEMIRCLLDAFPEAARSTDRSGSSPLHYACCNKNVDLRIVGVLLDLWPESVNHRSKGGILPLHALCSSPSDDERASVAVLDLLLAAAPHLATLGDSDGYLPIQSAIMRYQEGRAYSFCKRLIDAYPASLRVRIGGRLPIHFACIVGRDVETVKYILELHPESIGARDGDDNLPIHCAARSGGERKADVIRYLLVKDPRCASKAGYNGYLPLHFACGSPRRVCLESVRLLFDASPEAITIRDGGGRTPFDVVIAPELRAFLNAQLVYVRKAGDVTAMTTPDENGWLPLHHALRNQASLGAIKLLIKGNPSALRVAVNGLAFPLHTACEFSTVEVVQHLLGLSDNHLHTLDLQKNSTLHYACRGGNLGVVNYLVEIGAPCVSEPNSDGKLPIHLLWESDRVDRNSVEYVEANLLLLLAHPETVAL